MARKKNIHPDYKEVEFAFLNSPMKPITIKSTLKGTQKSMAKSIVTSDVWKENRKNVVKDDTIKDKYNI